MSFASRTSTAAAPLMRSRIASSSRAYATAPVAGAHPPPQQGGSRAKGTTIMLFASVAVLGTATATWVMSSRDSKKLLVSTEGEETRSKTKGAKYKVAKQLEAQKAAAQEESS